MLATILVILSTAVPELVRVLVDVALVVPTAWEPKSTVGGDSVAVPACNSRATVLLTLSATASSRRPSRFKSAATTDEGFVPVGSVTALWNVPSPLPRNREITLLVAVATAKSG